MKISSYVLVFIGGILFISSIVTFYHVTQITTSSVPTENALYMVINVVSRNLLSIGLFLLSILLIFAGLTIEEDVNGYL